MCSPQHESSAVRRYPYLTPLGVALVLPPCLYVVISSTILKYLQLKIVHGSVPTADFLLACSPDIAFALLLGTFFVVVLSLTQRAWQVLASVALAVIAVYSQSISLAQWNYFEVTGCALSSRLIEYWWTNMDETNLVMRSEGSSGKFWLMAGQAGALITMLGIPFIPAVRRRLKKFKGYRRSTGIMVLTLTLAIGLFFLQVHRISGYPGALGRHLPTEILLQFISQQSHNDVLVEVREHERLDSPIKLEQTPEARQHNIVLIIFESLGWNSSDVYIPELRTTPFLKELEDRSLVIDHHYVSLPHTSKALVEINCGIPPNPTHMPTEGVPGVLPKRCLADLLGRFGYETAFFQSALSFEHRDVLAQNMGYASYMGVEDLPHEDFERTSYFGMEEHIVLQPSMDWLDSLDDEPFLLTFLTVNSHHNYQTPSHYQPLDYPTEDLEHNAYLNAVRYTDAFLRDLFDEFQSRDLLGDTIFIIVGDHGEAFGEHGRRGHGQIVWEECLRVHSMIFAPGIVEPGTVQGIRSHMDIVPTVLDLLHLEVKEGIFRGRSLLSAPDPGRKLFHTCWQRKTCLAVREGPIKVIYNAEDLAMEVYNNATDPFDRHDLAYTGDFDEPFLEARKLEMLRWEQVVSQQYWGWQMALENGRHED